MVPVNLLSHFFWLYCALVIVIEILKILLVDHELILKWIVGHYYAFDIILTFIIHFFFEVVFVVFLIFISVAIRFSHKIVWRIKVFW